MSAPGPLSRVYLLDAHRLLTGGFANFDAEINPLYIIDLSE